MNIQHIFDLGVNQLVQVSVLIALAWMVMRLVVRGRAHLAYVLWLAVLIKSVTPPVWSSPVGVFSFAERGSQVAQPMARWDAAPAAIGPEHVAAAPVIQMRESSVLQELRPGWTFAEIAIMIWAVGAVGFMGFVAVRWIAVHRRIDRCCTLPANRLLVLVDDLRQKLGIRREIWLRVCKEPIGPAVIGFVRPVLVIPAAIAEEKSLRDLRPLVAHEIIHLRRGDPLVAMVQVISQAIWWFHPLVWWMNREIVRTREFCCDAEVIASADCRREDYAQMLIDVLRLRRSVGSLVGSPGIRPGHITERRLNRIMSGGQGLRRTPWGYWVLLGICGLVLLPGARMSSGGTTTEESAPAPVIDRITPTSAPTDNRTSEPEDDGRLAKMRADRKEIAEEIEVLKNDGFGDRHPAIEHLSDLLAVKDREIEAYVKNMGASVQTVRHFVAIVVDVGGGAYFQGKHVAIEKLQEVLKEVPDRAHTVLELAYASGDVTMRDFSEVESFASHAAKDLGFEYLSITGEHPTDYRGKSDQIVYSSGSESERIRPSLTPAAVSELTHVIPFQLGRTGFEPGDSIVITEVRGTSDKFEVDGTYQVKGTYTLTSHDTATLAISVTAKDPKNGRGYWGKLQTIAIKKGSGTFTVTERMGCEGSPHISFYGESESFGGVYFGTGSWIER